MARDGVRVDPGKVPYHWPAKGMANENEGPMFAQLRQSVVQFQVQLREGAGLQAGIAPRIAAAVIGADAGKARDARLHQHPIEREITQPVFDDDRGPPRPLQYTCSV